MYGTLIFIVAIGFNVLRRYLTLQNKLTVVIGILSLTTLLSKSYAVAQSKPNTTKTVVGESTQQSTTNITQRPPTPVFSGQQVGPDAVVPVGNQEKITDIVVRYVDSDGNLTSGKTNPNVITREFDLSPGDIYDAQLAREGLQGVLDLTIVDLASLTLEETTDNQAVMAIAIQESSGLSIGFGLTLPPPTALQGPIKPVPVSAISDSADGFGAGAQVRWLNLRGDNQKFDLGVEAGVETFGLNLGYRNFFKHDRGIGVNFFNSRNIESEFDDGDQEVNLPDGGDPWVTRLGGGIEYFRPLGRDFQGAIGLSYQRVSLRDGAFSDGIEPLDELGNQLTVSDDGQDDLLTLNFAAVLDKQNNPENPTRGFKLEFGSDQYLPVGEADILANRLAANYTQYLPVPLFGFGKGDRTLVLNLQGGTILGDAIPYDAFVLGGSSSVRGYDPSELGTSRSFVQASVEYRYPIFDFNAFRKEFDVGGTLFFDYANDLGSDDDVIGQPAVVRERPGDGFGYGLGLRTLTPIGAVRTEFALSDEGDTEFIFTIGDRF
ncbi:MAG: BamA/TamA family outer membrane protein [Cyanobacteria bacterium P01_A01_bin.83]